jgi:glycerol-3-phosphate cytidylyltransferase-like family protein
MEIISMIKGVDEVFLEESLELKDSYIRDYSADVLVMGDDWSGKFDHFKSICQVLYLPRTPCISTTAIIEKTRS